MAAINNYNLADNARFFCVPFVLFAWFVILTLRLCDLHLGTHRTRNATRIRTELPAVRGIIYDRNENPIAVNQPGYRIFVDPVADTKKKQSREATAARISQLTGRPLKDVYHDICTTSIIARASGAFITNRYIVQGVTFDISAKDIKTNNTVYCCAGIEPITKRCYPQGKRFAHVLGFVSGVDQQGRNGGIEQACNSFLNGTPGFYSGVKSHSGREIRERRVSTVEPIDGASVHLTIDQNIQYIVDSALVAAVTNFGAQSARAIVMKVDTGEILAMSSVPAFDPSDYKAYSGDARRNRTISGIYDPGSTMKSVTVSAGLNEGIITPDSTYNVGQGSWAYGGHILRDHAKGVIDIRTVLKKSSNIGAAKIALDLGNKRFERYLMAFGFGRKTGIELPGEECGILIPSERWEPVKPTRIAIGQGISVTPIQMITAYSAIANGGKMMRPYIISKIVSANGEILSKTDPKVVGRPISEHVSMEMREMLAGVVRKGGTGARGAVLGYTAAGKTGTSQMIVKDENGKWGYSSRDYWASFVGFIPASHPVFSVIVILDKPSYSNHSGGGAAAPVFSHIAEFVAQYLEIPTEHEKE